MKRLLSLLLLTGISFYSQAQEENNINTLFKSKPDKIISKYFASMDAHITINLIFGKY